MTEPFDDGGFACGLAADGLPVVAPTRARVAAMLGGADPGVVLGAVPPSLRPCEAWRAASCAVLAGCAPSAFPAITAKE